MTSSALDIVKAMLALASGTFALGAATFSFLEVARNEDHTPVQIWFQKKWEALHRGPWLKLPERLVDWLFGFRSWWVRSIHRAADLARSKRYLVLLPLNLFAALVIYLEFGPGAALLTLLLFLPGAFLRDPWSYDFPGLGRHAAIAAIVGMGLYTLLQGFYFSLYIPAIVVFGLLDTRPAIGAVLLPLALISWPCMFVTFGETFEGQSLEETAKKKRGRHAGDLLVVAFLLVTLVSAGISIWITLLALNLGSVSIPQVTFPQVHIPLLLSNLFFDFGTIAFTFLALAWARGHLLRIPIAIVADIAVAALFACWSLCWGLEVSFAEAWNVLLGRSLDGSRIELGPYFWAMHTTFLPVLAYCFLIAVAWLGKAMLKPVAFFFGKGQEHKNPLKLTAALCTLIAVFFGFVRVMVGGL